MSLAKRGSNVIQIGHDEGTPTAPRTPATTVGKQISLSVICQIDDAMAFTDPALRDRRLVHEHIHQDEHQHELFHKRTNITALSYRKGIVFLFDSKWPASMVTCSSGEDFLYFSIL